MQVFLKRLKQALGMSVVNPVRIKPLPLGSFSVISYCLMRNHFHLQIRQNSDIGIDKLIAKVCTSYAMYYNKKYGHVGNVFQDRFKAKLVENDSYSMYLSAYIHNNPGSLDYDYSSFKDIVGERNGQLVEKSVVLSWFNQSTDNYRKFVEGFSLLDREKIRNLLFEE